MAHVNNRQFDLSLSVRAVEDIAIRVCGRRLARIEILRACSALGWTVTEEVKWFYFWSPKRNPYIPLPHQEDRCHRKGKTAVQAWQLDLIIDLEEQLALTAAELA